MAPTSGGIASAPLEPGKVLQNRYIIERLLGGGGMGVVYLARDQRLANRYCAIKEMVDHFIDPKQRIEANEYFAREADTLAQLKHAAIPAITDRFDDQNRHYLVMEYVEGRNLEEEIAEQHGRLHEGLVIEIARQLCDVLIYLHGLQPPIIYRDMKPSNVMLTPKGRIVLIDFGIARLFKAARKGTMIGTLGFAPPEQYQGEVDPRSDIYSLAATLHYCLTGRDPEKFPPFSFPPVRDLVPGASGNLAGALDRALAYEVNARPAGAREFRDMMLYGTGLAGTGRAAVSPRSGTAGLTLPAGVEAAAPRKGRFRRAVAVVVLFVGLGGLAFATTYVYHSEQLQEQLGIKGFVDNLPWKRAEMLSKARANPLEFQRLTLNLSTREGAPISPPQAAFTDTQLTQNRYLHWKATFANALAGLEGKSEKVSAHFYNPTGAIIASSDASQFVPADSKTVEFGGVALMPDFKSQPPGTYKVALQVGGKTLAEQGFSVSQDLAAKARELSAEVAGKATAAAAAAAVAAADEKKRKQEEQKVAMIEARRRNPLRLVNIRFFNSTKSGTRLSGATSTFDVSKVLFVDWRVSFDNQLYGLETAQYRIDAAYVAPNGATLGAVNDIRTVPQGARTASFSGRVGNSAGGAFLPGTYTVNFYLNGRYFAQRKFQVLASATRPPGPAFGMTSGGGPTFPALDTPVLAHGQMSSIGRYSNAPIELRLRPQPNGFLHGELVVHEPGYGVTQLEGFVRGEQLQFQVPYGSETFFFEGRRYSDRLSGTFQATPSGARGTWATMAN